MPRPSDIHPEAVRLLEEADWPWSDHDGAFVESRDPERETTEQYRARQPTQIGYAELRDHGLAGSVPAAGREGGIR
jgi:hypothetical protein